MAADRTLDLTIEINAPIPIVWMAFANQQFLSNWYAPDETWVTSIQDFALEAGKTLTITYGPEGLPTIVEQVRIDDVIDYEKIKLSIAGKELTTDCEITLSAAEGERTSLHLIESGLDDDQVATRRNRWLAAFSTLNGQLVDDGDPQIWHGAFDAPVSRVWQALTSEEDIAKWFAPFPGAPIEVHECGYGVGKTRSVTFGKGEPWEHTITETFTEIDEGKGCTLSAQMIADGHSFSTIEGKIRLVGLDDGKTTMFLAITGASPIERAIRCNGWGMTLENLASVL